MKNKIQQFILLLGDKIDIINWFALFIACIENASFGGCEKTERYTYPRYAEYKRFMTGRMCEKGAVLYVFEAQKMRRRYNPLAFLVPMLNLISGN